MKLINKIVFIIMILSLASCSVDEGESYGYEILPIESIDLPHEFILGEEYFIDYTFKLPTDCHRYYDVFFNAENENRTVAATSIVYDRSNCQELLENNMVVGTFKFTAIYEQTYVFHIWKGQDEQGEDIYEIINVPIVN
ncbi:MAG: hypothetical protein ACPGU9_02440 [Flavobacteriaceae bacterium]